MSTSYKVGDKIIYGRIVINVVEADNTTVTCQFPDGSTKIFAKTDSTITKMEPTEESK